MSREIQIIVQSQGVRSEKVRTVAEALNMFGIVKGTCFVDGQVVSGDYEFAEGDKTLIVTNAVTNG